MHILCFGRLGLRYFAHAIILALLPLNGDSGRAILTESDTIIRAAVEQGILSEDNPVLSIIDSADILERTKLLHAAFPDNFFHTFAAKANLFVWVLNFLRQQGMGIEVASAGELELARHAGFDAASIVFDSPCKSRSEIQDALKSGISVNADNFQELGRITELVKNQRSRSTIGLRINPQVGGGSIDAMSTAAAVSKFGIALNDAGNRDRIVSAYAEYPWLQAIHVHVGSQGCPLPLMCAGIRAVVDLVGEINDGLGRQQIRVIDIGGGLPVNFAGESTEPTFEAYSQMLRSEVPQLFDESNNYTVITEFGRALLAKSGITVAKVEYTKTSGGQKIAITHAGAQVLLRTVMSPKDWMRRVSAFDSGGRPRTTNDVVQDVAGPCCFSGDVIAHRRLLPLIEVGDYIAVHDTGAYCFSAPFAYNGLPTPPVYRLIVSEESDIRFDKIGGGQSVSNLVAHFS